MHYIIYGYLGQLWTKIESNKNKYYLTNNYNTDNIDDFNDINDTINLKLFAFLIIISKNSHYFE